MKITYIHQHFKLPSEEGGSRPYEFARRLAADGHEVTMICGGNEARDEEIAGFRVIRLATPYANEMGFSARIRSFLNFMARASVTAAKQPADLVFASSTPLTVSVPGMVASVIQRVPMVFEVRDAWPEVPIRLGLLTNPVLKVAARMLEKITYAASREIVALSPGMEESVLAVAPRARTTVIPNASDFEVFDKSQDERRDFRSQQGWGDDETIIVYAGGFGYVYELDWVVWLAHRLRDENIRFVLIGQGSTSNELKQLAERLELGVDRLLLGRKPKKEVAKYVASADIILSSQRLDECLKPASLNKVFDAMAASRPVITNHDGWLTELLVDNDAGWRLDRDLTKAADTIREIAADKENLHQAGQRSAELGRKYFDRDKAYEKLRAIFSRVVGEGENK